MVHADTMKLSRNITRAELQSSARQAGGALLVAMIMIFLLSIMGVSAMQGSTLERRMATNSIQTATTFQGAESTSEIALNDPSLMTQAVNAADMDAVDSGQIDNSQVIELEVNLLQDIGMESRAGVLYIGDGPAYGFSAGTFKALRFVVRGHSEVDAIRADAEVVQGAYRIAPGI